MSGITVSEFERSLPENLDAERFVLGSILGSNETFVRVSALLRVEDFAIEKHRRIFARMGELEERGAHIDRVTLIDELRRRNQLEADGMAYVACLDDGLPEVHNLDSYVGIVREKAILRRAIAAGEALVQRCLRAQDSLDEIAGDAEALLKVLMQEQHRKNKLRTSKRIIDEAGGINAFFLRQTGTGIATPFAAINSTLVGFQPQQLIVLAARPAVGKSAWAMQVAAHAAIHQQKRTVVYSLEMSSDSLLRRAIVSRSKVSGMKVRRGMLDPSEWELFSTAVEEFQDAESLLFSEEAHVTTMAIRADIQRLKAMREPVDLVIVDYLQLMGSIGKLENRVQEVSQITRGLKLIAKEFQMPVLALSQLSRAIEARSDGRPVLSDLRESGTIEQDGDVILFLWPKRREDTDEEARIVNWEVAKQREGPTNHGELVFHKKTARFVEEGYVEEAA